MMKSTSVILPVMAEAAGCKTCILCEELAYIPPDREVCDICNQGLIYFNNDIEVVARALIFLAELQEKE